MEPAITLVDHADAHRYELVDEGVVAVIAEYQRTPGRITFTHTETMEGFAGRGLAKQLVLHALDTALADGVEVVPLCPFVRRVVTDHADRYLRLVPAAVRTELALPSA